jgi:putative hemolysin
MVYLILLPFLLLLSAFFSSAETVLFSITPAQRSRIRSKNPKADARLERCLADPALLLSTLLVGNTFVNFAVATLGYHMFDEFLPNAGGFAAVPAMTILLLIFGEITPKQIALRRTESLAPAFARPLIFWLWVLTPFNLAFRFASRAFSAALERERRALSDDELVSVLDAAAENGEFAADDAEMIEGVLRLSELHANDEMTPRVDMEAYDRDLPEAEREAARRAAKHRHLPVINRSPDIVEGVIDAATGEMQDALFVPETVTLDDLLMTFRRSGKPIAIVLDEYGGTAGLISQSDVLELIFGPSVFPRPDAEPAIVQKDSRTWEIDARANLDEINRELGLELMAEDADRLSGWVQFHAERLPHIGQQIEADGCRATILKRRRRRIDLVRLEVLHFPAVDSDAEMLAETDEAVEKTEEDDR